MAINIKNTGFCMILFLKTFSWETLGTDEFLGLNLLSFPVDLKMLDEDSLLMSAVYGESAC